VTFAPRFQFDPGHPWRPPFGVDRVGLTPVIVQFASDTRPAPEHWLAAYREGKEVDRQSLDVSGNSPFTARVTFATSPAPEELVLLAKDKDGKAIERARWKVERQALEVDAEAAADPVINPVDLGTILPPADWLVLGPEQQAVFQQGGGSRRRGARVVRIFAGSTVQSRSGYAKGRSHRVEDRLAASSIHKASRHAACDHP
jgi:hypothetical protein